MTKYIPDSLKEHILPFDWNVHKVWALDAAVVPTPTADFVHLLELPLWSSVPKRGMLFDTCPLAVIRNLDNASHQAARLHDADLRYPIDVLVIDGRRWILDGVHRIAKHFLIGNVLLPARFHDTAIIPAIQPDRV